MLLRLFLIAFAIFSGTATIRDILIAANEASGGVGKCLQSGRMVFAA